MAKGGGTLVKGVTNIALIAATAGIEELIERRRNNVAVAEVFSDDYRLKLDDAKRWLEEDGLRVEAVVARANADYKDCGEFEVVETNYKLKQKVAPGTRIILKYVTAEVIEESKKLFDELERQKAEAEAAKEEKKSLRADKLSGFKQGLRNSVKKVLPKTKGKEENTGNEAED